MSIVVVGTTQLAEVPYTGISIDGKKLTMIRTFLRRLAQEQHKNEYTVIINYFPNEDTDDLVLNSVVYSIRPVLYGPYIVSHGLPPKLARLNVTWVKQENVRVSFALSSEERAALQTLGLSEQDGTNMAKIKAQYKALAVQWHPDKQGGDSATFQRINAAYKLLQGEP